jgi:hypothetical protein
MSINDTRRDGLDSIPNQSKVNELKSENSYLTGAPERGGGGRTIGMSESQYRIYNSKLLAKRIDVYNLDQHNTTHTAGA